ncbi:ribosomal protein S6 modification protein [Haemophilus paracuniculus]|uniref:Ribosomal protein S6 modification protein n=1 Tax=Haemophilus paracuniculus TaxID=734 RepID=A0A1T0AS02_9PAST|nr:RimK family alpha-L-glutamate ligase [Haemophilus paracuniculus]OOR99174.1 ribosomal protein S6 modification protein [Haemophilus paracuniculus]
MRFLMLCRELRLYSCQRLKQACEQRGIELDILDPSRFLLNIGGNEGRAECYYQHNALFEPADLRPLPNYDGILPRFGTTSTEMGCRVLHFFEANGVPVLNNANAFRLARDKWQSLQALAAQQIPVPNSSFSGELVSVSAVIEKQSFPTVLKTLSGSQGIGVMLAENSANAKAILETLKQANVATLTQQFMAEAKGQDIRAFVIGDQVVATMARQGARGEFRANIHRGGQGQKITLNQAEQQLAVRASQAIGLDVAGVDLIRTELGLMVLEVNASAGLEMIEKVSGEDLAGQMIDFLLAKIKG